MQMRSNPGGRLIPDRPEIVIRWAPARWATLRRGLSRIGDAVRAAHRAGVPL